MTQQVWIFNNQTMNSNPMPTHFKKRTPSLIVHLHTINKTHDIYHQRKYKHRDKEVKVEDGEFEVLCTDWHPTTKERGKKTKINDIAYLLQTHPSPDKRTPLLPKTPREYKLLYPVTNKSGIRAGGWQMSE